jgi:sulfhydrogenase subunit gamma (sulfur reductase)
MIANNYTTLERHAEVDNQLFMPVPARIIRIKPLTALEKVFTLELPEGLSLGHRPGQFVEVSVMGDRKSVV